MNKTSKLAIILPALALVLGLAAAAVPAQAAGFAPAGHQLLAQADGGAAQPATGLKGAVTMNEQFSSQAGLSKGDLPSLVGKILRAFLGLLGSVFVVLTIYAGFLWMTAAGNEEQIGKAKKMLVSAVIGLVIIMMAWVITGFVLNNILTATTGTGTTPP